MNESNLFTIKIFLPSMVLFVASFFLKAHFYIEICLLSSAFFVVYNIIILSSSDEFDNKKKLQNIDVLFEKKRSEPLFYAGYLKTKNGQVISLTDEIKEKIDSVEKKKLKDGLINDLIMSESFIKPLMLLIVSAILFAVLSLVREAILYLLTYIRL